jgi:hypothetical protein
MIAVVTTVVVHLVIAMIVMTGTAALKNAEVSLVNN